MENLYLEIIIYAIISLLIERKWYTINRRSYYTKLGSDHMKIEKLSDNQIRCILDKSDLVDRQLKISELAYGSEKAKDLFRDMMRQAAYEFGFEAENIPLMIEAIPVSTECIVLVITKVEDPEELDTRFSKFTPDDEYEYDDEPDLNDVVDSDNMESLSGISSETLSAEDNGADDVINLFNKVKEYLSKNVAPVENNNSNSFIPFHESLRNSVSNNGQDSTGLKRNITHSDNIANIDAIPDAVSSFSVESEDSSQPLVNIVKVFSFTDLDTISNAARIVLPMYDCSNTLYKDTKENIYYLLIEKDNCPPATFNKICNILTEYGKREHFSYASPAFYAEHFDAFIKGNALQVLSRI